MNDLFRLCNYLGIFKPKLNKYKPKAKAISNDDDDDKKMDYRSTTNVNYDARFKSIEKSLLQSIFYKKHNKIASSYI